MNSQPPLNLMGMLMMAAILRMGYELSQPVLAEHKEPTVLLPASSDERPLEEQWSSLLPWQRRASKKAVENYAAVQEKKWQHWNEVMFEPTSRKQRQKLPRESG